jgi:hypothetical protein
MLISPARPDSSPWKPEFGLPKLKMEEEQIRNNQYSLYI